MTRKALIIGAGVGGLAAAWWLNKIGWETQVLEKAPDLRANGYMLGLSGPGYDVAKRMGIMPALEARARHIRENLYLGRDGRELMRIRYHDFFNGIDWLTMARTSLVEVLYEAVRDRTDIRFGITVASVDDGTAATDTKARITLTDGTVHEADLVIGADGIHSALRALSFGPEANFAERLGYRIAAFQVEDKLGLGHDFLSYAEPGRLSEFYTLSAERLATLYVWKSDLAGSIAEPCRRTVLKEAFAGGHPSCLQLIDDLADDEPLFFDDMTMIRMPAWSKGRVLLLGDSAHCLTLLSGQGAGMAMASACILADELARHDVPAALASHEARLRPAILRLQTRSLKMAPLFIPATNRAFSVRNFILRHTPRRLLNWYFVRGIRSEILAATEI